MSCVELHQPIHHHYCVADYKTRFPIVTGLNVVPLAEAANAMQKQLSASTTPATSISLPPPTATTAKLTLLEASIIQSRCDTIRRYMAEANGTPVCAICGDSCIATVEKTEDQRHIDRTTSPDGQDCAMKISRRFSGDHGTEQKAYQRLMRFAGMLLCQPCVKIQAAARK